MSASRRDDRTSKRNGLRLKSDDWSGGVRSLRIALVSMPFTSIFRPSIQLGTLKQALVNRGLTSDAFYLNLRFAKMIGVSVYESLCRFRGTLLGEWLFSKSAFQEKCPSNSVAMLNEVPVVKRYLSDAGLAADDLLGIRDQVVPAYLSGLLSEVSWSDYDVVGFTSTFEQNTPSFAMARTLKVTYPHLLCIFGGANFDGPMGAELVRSVECIDYAVSGPGESALPDFLLSVQKGSVSDRISGVLSRERILSGRSTAEERAEELPLDEAPIPDYSDYFVQAFDLDLLSDVDRMSLWIPFEASRGCWWGAKHHCTFCGLNGSTMKYRTKSSERVLAELATQFEKHGSFYYEAVDNIFDPHYFATLIPALQEQRKGYRLFFEIKANLKREQIRQLAMAGIGRVQPGIESFSSQTLSLMKKGITGLQNINALRWLSYYGIHVTWNLLWGFPGESHQEYEAQALLLPLLRHLPPPEGCGRISVERFSPLFYDRTSYPAEFIRPLPAYRYIYPQTYNLNDLAYFFECRFAESLADEAYRPLSLEVQRWQTAWSVRKGARPSLCYWYTDNLLIVEDRRNPSDPQTHTWGRAGSLAYLACSEQARTAEAVATCFNAGGLLPTTARTFLEEFCSRKLMYCEGERYLSLGLPGRPGTVPLGLAFTPTREA